MFAVVLVGGFGTRLRPLTNTVPKPMLPVVHRPMIVHLADRLEQAGVTDIVLALGFKPEPFFDTFPGNLHGDGVRVHYAVEPEPLDTAGAIAFAARHVGIDETFLVCNGDNVTALDLRWLVEQHRQFGVQATIHLTPVDDPSAFGVVECDPDGLVGRFVEKPAPGESDSNLVNAGTYVFEPSVLDLIEPDRRVSVERETFPKLVAERQLAAIATDDYWIDAGRPELYLQVNLDRVTGRAGSDDGVHPDASVDASAEVADSVIDADVEVGPRCSVTRSLLMRGARLAAGTQVTDSIVAGSVGTDAVITSSVIGAGYVVADGSVVTDAKLPTVE